jgi:hypothetical protein
MIRKSLAASVVVAGVIALGVAPAPAQFVPYDGFERARIAPQRWRSFEGLPASLEVVRRIQEGKLRLDLTTSGSDQFNGGTTSGFAGLVLQDSADVVRLSAEVTVNRLNIRGCPSNPSQPLSVVELGGNFFHTRRNTPAGDQTGDIRASINLIARGEAESGPISGGIGRCLNSTCTQVRILQDRMFETEWQTARAQIVQVLWRPRREDFLFRVNPGPDQENLTLSYQQLNVPKPPAPAHNPLKFVRVRNFAANCTSGSPFNTLSASIDNVETNELNAVSARTPVAE